MTISTHVGNIVFEDLKLAELVAISVLKLLPKYNLTHMFSNIEIITQKIYLQQDSTRTPYELIRK